METLAIGVIGLVVIAFSASLAPKLRIASPLVLVVLGIGISLLPGVPDVVVDPEWILAGVLPPLLYSAAVSMPAMDFRRDLRTISGLAIVLVVVSAVALGFVFHALIPSLPLPAAIALGAIVSPTDAVATSIVKDVGVSHRLTAVLEGESLLNDATALALLRSAVAVAVIQSAELSAGTVAWDFLRSLAIAIAIGWVVGRANLMIRRRVTDTAANTVLSFAVPFLASIPAEVLDASGLVAAVVAGLVTGHGAARYFPPTQRAADARTWRTVELVLEGAVFLIMGLELSAVLDGLGSASAAWRGVMAGLLAIVVVLLVRAVYVAVLVSGLQRRKRRLGEHRRRVGAFEQALGDDVPPKVRRRVVRLRSDLDFYELESFGWRDGGVLVWAGMRGVVTLVAAQTLPATFPHRSLLVLIAFVVAAVSLLVQGGTLPWLVRVLRPSAVDADRVAQEYRELNAEMLEKGLAEVVAEAGEGSATPGQEVVMQRLRELVRRREASGAVLGAGPGGGIAAEAAGAGAESREDEGRQDEGREGESGGPGAEAAVREVPPGAAPGSGDERPDGEALGAAMRQMRLRLVQAQRHALLRARDEGRYSSVVLTGALEALDAEQIALEVRADLD
ncbi:sodium/proton antiporter (CPA1 family) [Salana multivorans]|uniref:Sodium/proton antiporter (CPA1 family) n=1 Tax=Salana multivorans TaxID=120377 RepID=A0A3N2DAN6_9MICO|nr:sodium:proton antiporter [Salana multivorans]ROR96762.1 sodium/proton antiporter (CPA1 family) [Salana multivorans]